MTTTIDRDAWISQCGQYRYLLTRSWKSGTGVLAWVMLNPSTADASIDDPTIRRVMNFTAWAGYQEAHVLNLFALRATNPKTLESHPSPVGPCNDEVLAAYAEKGLPMMCAWGVGGGQRAEEVLAGVLAGADRWCLDVTKAGHPRHPLYVRGDQPFRRF